MKWIIYFIIIVMVLTIAGCNNNECYNCGESGWEIMDLECNSNILTEDDLINCLMKFDLYPLEIDANEVEQGYIEIGDEGLIDNPTENSIRVFKFHQWAADERGNMYLESMLG